LKVKEKLEDSIKGRGRDYGLSQLPVFQKSLSEKEIKEHVTQLEHQLGECRKFRIRAGKKVLKIKHATPF